MAAGTKHDAGKGRWHLLPWEALIRVVDVLTFGADKYGANNWREVDDWRARYDNAMERHLVAWRMGKLFDEESKLPHLAHAACCLLFLLALELDE